MTDDEIKTVFDGLPEFAQWTCTAPQLKFARAIIAAHNAKLLAGLEMPEPALSGRSNQEYFGQMEYVEGAKDPMFWKHWFTKDQLQQYAAAAAAKARMKALEDAKRVCLSLFDLEDDSCNEAEQCAAAIELLKGGE